MCVCAIYVCACGHVCMYICTYVSMHVLFSTNIGTVKHIFTLKKFKDKEPWKRVAAALLPFQ